jgi:hypothetical protein
MAKFLRNTKISRTRKSLRYCSAGLTNGGFD